MQAEYAGYEEEIPGKRSGHGRREAEEGASKELATLGPIDWHCHQRSNHGTAHDHPAHSCSQAFSALYTEVSVVLDSKPMEPTCSNAGELLRHLC